MPEYGSTKLPLEKVAGQVLRQFIVAERDQPPFDRATMDGIAIAGKALQSGHRKFQVAGIQAAGQQQSRIVDSGHCLETMTGAVMPNGSDTMIPVERIAIHDNIATLEEGYNPDPGQFVHKQASDHRADDVLLKPGTRIGAPEMAILTAAGQPDVEVALWPRVAIISTGDELVDVGAPIGDAQIRSSNDRAIETALHSHGCMNTRRIHLPDDPVQLLAQMKTLHEENDVLILSGGVSMGKYDYVPRILDELGVRLVFHKILQRPGLPMWFGISADNKPVFALPGNPVSTLVCLIRYVRPALERSLGLNAPAVETAQLTATIDFESDLCWFLPVALESNPAGLLQATPRPTNTSGDFIGLRGTDGVIELQRGMSSFPVGHAARLYRW
jgi:molybdopterin molybdotransferase